MNPSDEIESLKSRIEELLNQQDRCQHDWGSSKSDPEKYREAHYSHLEGHGSDPYPVYTYTTAYKPRWSRECLKCGKKQYTYEQRATASEPYFN